ncbi:MAG TPA: hypothetical protein PKH07_18910 [bacterium]|nr:hypothetical protein [bacterium]
MKDNSSDLESVQMEMQPGVLTLEGFLGTDSRSLAEIVQADDAEVQRLGLTHERIAERLTQLTQMALQGFGTPQKGDEFSVVCSEAIGGWVRCPFRDKGRFRKGEIVLTDKNSGRMLTWTPLSVHLIEEHGFYQGRGSHYRLEPSLLKEMLF